MSLALGEPEGGRAFVVREPSPPADVHPGLRHNVDVEWDEFAPDAYWQHNYSHLRQDDLAIIKTVGRFFSEQLRFRGGALSGIDVGSGSNLYPALAMLPFCGDITLTDFSNANVAWLENALRATARPWEWQPFWDVLATCPGYSTFPPPVSELGQRVKVEQRSVFDLPRDRYDVGTMFFVAESMTNYENEFETATEAFLRSLHPGSTFAAAFMDSSLGYVVGDKFFPAVDTVDITRVRAALAQHADANVEKVEIPADDPLRDGYQGMIIAVGTTKG